MVSKYNNLNHYCMTIQFSSYYWLYWMAWLAVSAWNLSRAIFQKHCTWTPLETKLPCLLTVVLGNAFTNASKIVLIVNQNIWRVLTNEGFRCQICCWCRNSSGFSRGASMYRGVTRCRACSPIFTPHTSAAFSNTPKTSEPLHCWIYDLTNTHIHASAWLLVIFLVVVAFPMRAGITSTGDGRPGLGGSQGTRTCILAHSVSFCHL